MKILVESHGSSKLLDCGYARIKPQVPKPATLDWRHVNVDGFWVKNSIFEGKGIFSMLEDINTGTVNIQRNVCKMKRWNVVTHSRRLSKNLYSCVIPPPSYSI
ncbi:MAG: hypothetical protein ACFFBQ_18135 [Promethearchaeota archaeon]